MGQSLPKEENNPRLVYFKTFIISHNETLYRDDLTRRLNETMLALPPHEGALGSVLKAYDEILHEVSDIETTTRRH